MSEPTLLILAAGMGSRYGGLKQLDPMGPHGETVLDYSVFDALRGGFKKVVFVIRRDFEEEFKSKVGSKFDQKVTVEYAFQSLDDLPAGFTVPEGRVKPWGTTQAVLAAESKIDGPFAMINADDFYGRDAFAKLAANLGTLHPKDGKTQYSMVGFQLRKTLSEHGSVSRGVCTSKDGKLTTVTEMTKIFKTPTGASNQEDPQNPVELSGDELVSMNFWGFTTDLFPQLHIAFEDFLKQHGEDPKSESYIPKVVDALIQSGQAEVEVLETTSSWFGITYPEDKNVVVESIKQLTDNGEYPSPLWA
ncbi:nucleotidyltransferase [Phragmitibacter flavus]|uniref:Nucleotidyltransferase n=1 Tax=Phragmitibacter flavus TaxID=2576071 RepID=A0A5R8KHW8_9BACT|nr:sugar phosphate nucleotidyltransferase [Phragmitibacter flavus]TLD71914.1 nucleotidyltransferase [Phragmitibacter flavus]